MALALRVIHTWAAFWDGSELHPKHIAKLTTEALRRFRPFPRGKEQRDAFIADVFQQGMSIEEIVDEYGCEGITARDVNRAIRKALKG